MCIHIPIVDIKNTISEKLSILCICMYLHTCIQHLTLHTITVLPLTTVYFVSEVHCTLNVHVVPDIIKFTYYHCTSIDYSVHCE